MKVLVTRAHGKDERSYERNLDPTIRDPSVRIGSYCSYVDVRQHYDGDGIEFRPLEREDACAISTAKAQRLLGWTPRRTWRDYLDENGRART
jgi:hypothetical protein